MAYKYDVFVSYRRAELFKNWVSDVFFNAFEAYLSEELPSNARIFWDKTDIHAGDNWAERIHDSLIHSRILVPILIPSYFRSEWCMREFAVFQHRETNHQSSPNGLILPIKLHDGEHFPPYATKIQMLDCRAYNVAPLSRETALYTDFHKQLQEWVKEVRLAWHRAPEFDHSWKDRENWCEKPYQNMQLMQANMPQAPKL